MTDGVLWPIKEANICGTLLTLNINRTIIEKYPNPLAQLTPWSPLVGYGGPNKRDDLKSFTAQVWHVFQKPLTRAIALCTIYEQDVHDEQYDHYGQYELYKHYKQ